MDIAPQHGASNIVLGDHRVAVIGEAPRWPRAAL
jgi:hypothetical protein